MSDVHDLARSLIAYWCGGYRGRDPDSDSVSWLIDEGRYAQAERARALWNGTGQKPYTYSSCGDLPHSLYWYLGVRSAFVNHGSDPVTKQVRSVRAIATKAVQLSRWRVRLNISLLLGQGRAPILGEYYEPGDVLLIDGPPLGWHAMVAVSHLHSHSLVVGEYGQPGGHLRDVRIDVVGKRMFVGSRQLKAVIKLVEVLDRAEGKGELVSADSEQIENAEAWSTVQASLRGTGDV